MPTPKRRKSGFAKIYGEITESTLWDAPSDIRIVWVTILAKCDQDGYLRFTPRSLAAIANVSQEACREAIEFLQRPDPDSKCKDHDGRRIILEPGGLWVVSHQEYRSYRTPKQIRDAEHQAACRARKSAKSHSAADMSADTVSASVSDSGSGEKVGGSGGKKNPDATPVRNWRVPPDDWRPLPALIERARSMGLDPDLELEKFQTFEQNRIPTDWNLPFKRWLLNAKPSKPPKPGKVSTAPKPTQPSRGFR